MQCKFDGRLSSSNLILYAALVDIVVGLTWLEALLRELGIGTTSASTFWCDNLDPTYTVVNILFHVKTKYVGYDHHFIRESRSRKALFAFYFYKVSECKQFTKPLSTQRFTLFCFRATMSLICERGRRY